jgi:hypothetical protein
MPSDRPFDPAPGVLRPLTHSSTVRNRVSARRRTQLRARAGVAVLAVAALGLAGAAVAGDTASHWAAAPAGAGAPSRTPAAPAAPAAPERTPARTHERGASGVVPVAGARGQGAALAPGAAPTLDRIAACESGGNPSAVSADGAYRGKYQFSRSTWTALGGRGDPAKASEDEQDARAAALIAHSGTSAWPTCG